MFELNGQYGSCKVFTNNCDNETISQLTNLLNQDFVTGSQIRIMPDIHAGKGCVIGTTMTLTDRMYACNKHQLGVIADEVMFWDGNVGSMQYTSTRKENADFIQYAFAATGRRTSLSADTRYKNVCWKVSVSAQHPRVSLAGSPKTTIEVVKSVDGFKYCFTTNTGFWIMRRGGCICVTGNCGMYALKLQEKSVNLRTLDTVIRQYIPYGFSIREEAVASSNISDIIADVDVDKAMKSLGTLGGGNHFIEVDKSSDGSLWLVIHTGSRHLGIEVCDYYQNLAYKRLTEEAAGGDIHTLTKELVERLTKEGRQKEISKAITALKKEYKEKHPNVPFELAYVKGDDFKDYIHDMKLTQEHALINRETIAKIIVKRLGLHVEESFQTIHNYIDTENMILRKGSVSARAGERLLIPMNMRDGSLICVGKGNPDWNYSAPHGAGRLMSRAKAKESISMKDYINSMEGIFTTCVNSSTIDESAFAYKPMEEIMENIKDTVDIVDVIKPIYNFKASE